jgi:plastocyanin
MRMIWRLLAAFLVAVYASALLAAQPAAAATHSIAISGYTFSPAAMTITAGDTVTWTNDDQAPHDVTTTSGPVAIHGSTMSKGQSWSYTFTTPGTYSYICSIHPDMTASLTVVAAHPAPTTHATTSAPTIRTVVPQAQVQPVRRPGATTRARHASPTHAASTPAAASSPSVAAQPAASTSNSERPLRPLLIVAGIIAAVATLSLLILAARPEDAG